MVAPRGAQELQNVRKPRSWLTLGPPFGRPFSVLSALNFENGPFLSVFGDFFADSKKASKKELPGEGKIGVWTMPADVS